MFISKQLKENNIAEYYIAGSTDVTDFFCHGSLSDDEYHSE